MTTVYVLRNDGGLHGFTVTGHAGFAKSGRDIVCAAISSLISTCANALETVAGVQPLVTQDEKTATITVTLPPQLTGEREHDGQIILQTILQGLTDIALQYPDYIQIK